MKIRLASLIHDSIVDGEGLRTVIFTQGCPHNCPGCHNQRSIPFEGGTLLDISDVIAEVLKRDLKRVTFSGGEPFVQAQACYYIAKELKDQGYQLWSYSGFTFEVLMRLKDPYIQKFLSQLDVLIDGPFVLSKRSLSTLFRGSTNQRIIDVPKSLLQNKAIVVEKYQETTTTKSEKAPGIFI